MRIYTVWCSVWEARAADNPFVYWHVLPRGELPMLDTDGSETATVALEFRVADDATEDEIDDVCNFVLGAITMRSWELAARCYTIGDDGGANNASASPTARTNLPSGKPGPGS
jgi:hypothetical protein